MNRKSDVLLIAPPRHPVGMMHFDFLKILTGVSPLDSFSISVVH